MVVLLLHAAAVVAAAAVFSAAANRQQAWRAMVEHSWERIHVEMVLAHKLA